MRFTSIFSAAALTATTLAQATPSLVYQFENAFSGVGYVNIENIAVRPNGKLLLNTVTGAIMAQLDPANPQPEIVANLTNALGNGQPGSLTGIAETCPDTYTVAAGNFLFGPSVPGGVAGVPGSFSVWNVNLNSRRGNKEPKISQVASIPEANTLNGVTAIPGGNKDLVLIADSGLGAVWAVNTKTGEYYNAIQSDLFMPGGESNFGINGVQVQGRYLYFTNSAQMTFGAVPIDLQTGKATGEVTVFATFPEGGPDDFDFKPNQGGAYVAVQENSVYQVTQDGSLNLVAGGGGGPTGPQSGQVFSLDTCAAGSKLAKKWVA
ncbi:hypothetical protein LTR70_010036 [Exophiala xenobiotica]|uniref:Uncharacterized protein n=1 Tax=Lithohypha guttulata TaxID=1690604 RepID=A0ABR0KIF1_9EURO|nr:hypothetical protein LTR24_002892 [Lithohypha guttulata]KAK5309746.1 hypothetical protein LTR70_010036 [Exophiala xenobiotica]